MLDKILAAAALAVLVVPCAHSGEHYDVFLEHVNSGGYDGIYHHFVLRDGLEAVKQDLDEGVRAMAKATRGGKKGRKVGRNKKKCELYRKQGRREKNKERIALKEERKRQKKESRRLMLAEQSVSQ